MEGSVNQLHRGGDELGVVPGATTALELERVLESDADAVTVPGGPAEHGPRGALVTVHHERQRVIEYPHDLGSRGERILRALFGRLDQRTQAGPRERARHEATRVVGVPDARLDRDTELEERRH